MATFFAAVFLATPLVLSLLSGRHDAPAPKFREWAQGEVEILDGRVDAKHAFVMVLIAPAACGAGITAVGLVAWLVSLGIV